MKRFFIFIIIITYNKFKADTLHIYFNSNTCKSCNLIGKQIEKYKNYKKIMYLTKDDSLVKDELLESYGLNVGLYQFKFVNNNFFENIDGRLTRSYCIIQKGNNFKDTFLLGDYSKLKVEETFNFNKLKLSKNLKFSNTALISKSNNYILINDSKLNKISIAMLKNDSLVLIDNIKSNFFSKKKFFDCKCIDEKLYSSLKITIDEMNLSQPEYRDAYIVDNVLNLIVVFNVPSLPIYTSDTVIGMKLFLFTKNLISEKTSFTCISKDGLNETDAVLGNKFFITNSCFIKKGDTIYLPIVSNDTAKLSLFVKQIITNKIVKSLGITKDLGDLIPKDCNLNTNNLSILISRSINKTDYFFTKVPLVYNLRSKKTYFINNSNLIKKLNSIKLEDAYINDVKIINDKAIFLIKVNNSWYKEEYNLLNNELINTKLLKIDPSINSLTFNNGLNNFFMYSSSKNAIYISN